MTASPGYAPRWDAIVGAPGFALGIVTTDAAVLSIEFLPERIAETARNPNPIAAEAVRQLTAYLLDPHFRFDLPLASAGSAHQQAVWQVLNGIAPGHTLTYGDVARRVGSSARAVGAACGANPLPVIVPCHRVTAAGGALGGFAHSTEGFLPGIKRWLLNHEAACAAAFTLTPPGSVLS
jgi:methylated-DNA-[protein]-cysteine S-methyltransferase